MGIHNAFARVFGVDPATLDDSTSPETVQGWDSFGHLALVQELEATFGVTFGLSDISEMDSIGGIKRVLARRGAQP